MIDIVLLTIFFTAIGIKGITWYEHWSFERWKRKQYRNSNLKKYIDGQMP